MTLDVTTMTFGNQLQNTTSATQTVTITNTGNANLTGVNAVSSNTAFKVANNGCSAAIAPNGTCMIDVTFTPTATGALTANLTVSGTGVTDGTVAMTGTGTASSVTGADALNGQKLFLANCASCHTSNPAANISRVTLGVSAQVSKNAINANMGGMGSLTSLSTQDLNDIAAYIGAQTNQKPTLMSSTPAATGGTSTNVGGGGCTIGTTDSPFDPLLVLMAAISAVVLVRRQSKR
jgi:mono/diheme cytochrome c family protein